MKILAQNLSINIRKNLDNAAIDKNLVGSWYLVEEQDWPVIPNSQGKVSVYTLNANSVASFVNYVTEPDAQNQCWITSDEFVAAPCKWTSENGILKLLYDNGESELYNYTLNNNNLILISVDDDLEKYKFNKNSYN